MRSERLKFDLLFRWFVGLGVDEPVWDASTFSKNRDRLLAGEVAGLAQVKLRGLERVDFAFVLGLAAYNLVRLPKLLEPLS